ncbi:uncharacterized protein LOC111893369 [Lactuca sativa]|uniref:uncharacterized protein LOC111893369 n=1 Tax=Lactuca sativa TaxID=4236 RepID=UPI000CD9DC89|nr:uncharacterized protein LOC111893369 [Lactuca sativa]
MKSSPRINKHISFSSPSHADDTEHHGLTPTIGDTTEPMIQDEHSPTPCPSPQVDTFHQIETLTQSINKRLNKVEKNVNTMKRLMALDGEYDDDMVVDDTPPNSPGHNPPPPPPSSTNPPLPSPSPSHPPPKTPSPTPKSPPQSDATKKGENYQEGLQPMQMVIVSQPEMTERSEAKVDPLEPIVVADTLDNDAAFDQPIPDAFPDVDDQ